eukprot:gene8067-8262_t
MAEYKPQAVKDVPAQAFIQAYAAHLKSTDKLQIPDWVDVLFDLSLPPAALSPAAAVMRQLYVRQGLGVGQLRMKYGGLNKRMGVHPEHFTKASGGLIRNIMKQFEGLGFLENISPQDVGGTSAYWVGLSKTGSPSVDTARQCDVVLYYVHGGGFIAGDPLMAVTSFKYWMASLAKQGISSQVLCINYPLAPEHPFPAGVVSVAAGYAWLSNMVAGSRPVLVPGDEASVGQAPLASIIQKPSC